MRPQHTLLVLALGAALAGCSSTGESQRFWRGTAESLLPGVQAANRRHAALVRAGAPALAATDEATGRIYALRRATTLAGGESLWLAPDGAGFAFRDGILVATRGTPADLMSADIDELRGRLATGRNGLAKRFHSRLDGEGHPVTESYVCTVTISGDTAREDCAGSESGFVNSYGIVPGTDAVLFSRQHVAGGARAYRFGAEMR